MEKVQNIDEFGYDENGINLELVDKESDKFTPVTHSTISKVRKRFDKIGKINSKYAKGNTKLVDYCVRKKILEDKNLDEITSELAQKYYRSENKMRSFVRPNLSATDPNYKNESVKKAYKEGNDNLDIEEKELDEKIASKERQIQRVQIYIQRTKENSKNINEGEIKQDEREFF